MVTKYKHRFIILSHRDKQSEANTAAAKWDPDTGGDKTFEHLTLATDLEQDLDFAVCNTAATDEMKEKIMAALGKHELDAVYDVAEGWTLEKVMNDAGLKMPVEEIPVEEMP